MPSAALTLPGQASSVPAAHRSVETVLDTWRRPEVVWVELSVSATGTQDDE